MQGSLLLLDSGGSPQAQDLVFHNTYERYFHPPQEVFILSVLVANSFGVRSVSRNLSSQCQQ